MLRPINKTPIAGKKSGVFFAKRRRLSVVAALGAFFSAGLSAQTLAQVTLPAPVEQSSLERDLFANGPLTPAQGALTSDLWRGADPQVLADLLSAAPARPASPGLGDALRRTLLTPGAPPQGAPAALGGRKVLALARAGHIEAARTLVALSNAPKSDADVARAMAEIALLDNNLKAPCALGAGLSEGRDAPFWVKLRVFCYGLGGEYDAADLTLGLLRDGGALSETDEQVLSAFAAGATLKEPPAPKTALHLAMLRRMNMPILAHLTAQAEGGVLVSIAQDEKAAAPTRLEAAVRASAMGALEGAALRGVYRSVAAGIEPSANPLELVQNQPADLMTDAALFAAIEQQTSPDALRMKATLIAAALGVSQRYERRTAAAKLYAEDLAALEGALVAPSEAAQFAVARMIVGDGSGAARWLYAMLGSDPLSSMDVEMQMAFIDLTNLLKVLDPIAAASIAETAGIALDPDFVERASVDAVIEDEDALAEILSLAFDAALGEIAGQSALAALAASDAAPLGAPMARVLINRSLAAAGLSDLIRPIAFEAVLKARSGKPQAAGATASVDNGPRGFGPRIKPTRTP